MSNQRMDHPEGHSNWAPTPTAGGGSPLNDGVTSTSAPQPTPCNASDMSGGGTSMYTKGTPGEYAHASLLSGNLEEESSVNPISKGTVWTEKRELRIYSAALSVHAVIGAALGWIWHLADVSTNNDAWGYVLRWSCMAWVAAECVLVCVWSSARRELKRERQLTAKVYAAESGLSSEDGALFVETVVKVS
jgi:hypothetical protein